MSTKDVFNSNIVLKVRAPQQHERLKKHEVEALNENSKLISFIQPAQNKDLVELLKKRNVTSLAMD